MNWKNIGFQLFISPLYGAIAILVGWFLFMIGMAAWEALKLFLFTSWQNFFLGIAAIWGCAIVCYLIYKYEESWRYY